MLKKLHIGEFLEDQVRRRKDLTIRKFAYEIGVSEPTVYKIYKSENGDRISLPILDKICGVLKIDVSYFFDAASPTITQNGLVNVGRDNAGIISVDECKRQLEILQIKYDSALSEITSQKKIIALYERNEQ